MTDDENVFASAAAARAPANVLALQALWTGRTQQGAAELLHATAKRVLDTELRARLASAAHLIGTLDVTETSGVLERVREEISASDGTMTLDRWRHVFDDLAETSPSLSVAAYTFGDSNLLNAATAAIVDKLQDWGLLSPTCKVLDLGCGSGRLAPFLAPRVAEYVGLDISPKMIERARQSLPDARNVRFDVVDGVALHCCDDATADLILAVDMFPYLVDSDAGAAVGMLRDFARVLVPGGDILILNYSYALTPEQALASCRGLAALANLQVVRHSVGDLANWDGVTYHLKHAEV